MEKVISISTGEIFLKGKNYIFFENLLFRNIKASLHGLVYRIYKNERKFFVSDFDTKFENEMVSRLKKVMGISHIFVSIKVATEVDIIMKALDDIIITKPFKVITNRADKKFPFTSQNFSIEAGGRILENNKNAKVDIHNPEQFVYIDIRQNFTFIAEDKIIGQGGLPVGASGNGLSLLSGGIDSPVASYMIARRGMNISYLHFHSYPHTSEKAKDKVITLAKIVSDYSLSKKIYMVSATKVQEEIAKHCHDSYGICLLRRFMMRVAEKICEQNNFQTIITGENLGQVASQTIEGMTMTNSVVKNLPIIRPLVAFDKNDIIDIARKIGTYETSILPFEDCCTIFLPSNPVIKPKEEKVIEEEQKIDMNLLVQEAINSLEIIEINNH